MEQLRQEKLEIDQQLRAIQGTNLGSMQNFPMNRRSDRGYSNDMDSGSRSNRGQRGRGGKGSSGGGSGGRGAGGNSRYGNNQSRKFYDDTDDDGREYLNGSFTNKNYRKTPNTNSSTNSSSATKKTSTTENGFAKEQRAQPAQKDSRNRKFYNHKD